MNKFKIGDRAKVLAASNNIPNYSDHVGREYDVIDVSHYGDVKLSHSIFYHDPSWLELMTDKPTALFNVGDKVKLLPHQSTGISEYSYLIGKALTIKTVHEFRIGRFSYNVIENGWIYDQRWLEAVSDELTDTIGISANDWKAQSLHLATTTDMKWRAIARKLGVAETTNREWLTSQIGSKKEWDKQKVEARVDKVVTGLATSIRTKQAQERQPRLKMSREKVRKISNDTLDRYLGIVEDNSRILVISDLHIPYHHPDAISFLRHLKAKYSPTRVICMGDELDHSALSYHDTDPDLYNAGDELARSLPFIQELKELFPVMDILDSNHGSMVWRKAKTHGIPRHYIKSYNDVLGVDSGWKWMFDLTIELPNGNKCYFHHGKSSDVVKLSQIMGMCAVQGHYHEKFKIDYWSNPIGLYWGLQTGCLISDKSLAFSYNNVNIKRPTIGTAVIINSQPILEPLIMNEDGRWIGIKNNLPSSNLLRKGC